MGYTYWAHHLRQGLATRRNLPDLVRKVYGVLSHEKLVELVGAETADELERAARGEHVDETEMSLDDVERWTVTGEGGPWPE